MSAGRDSLPISYTEKLAEQIPVLGPALGPLAKRAAEAVAREWERNQSVALKAAERAAGMSREQLEEFIATVPGAIPLTTRLLFAAGMNGHDATLKGMGRTLGHAVREPARTDEANLILAALADFGPSHRAVLEALEAKPTDAYWGDDEVCDHVALSGHVARLSLSALNARGLVRGVVPTRLGSSNVAYSISELGQTVLEVLREVEAEDEAASP